jgi:hypothetical protein
VENSIRDVRCGDGNSAGCDEPNNSVPVHWHLLWVTCVPTIGQFSTVTVVRSDRTRTQVVLETSQPDEEEGASYFIHRLRLDQSTLVVEQLQIRCGPTRARL